MKTKKGVRTVNGCITCRERKVKCDGQPNQCRNCNRLGLQCRSYPEISDQERNMTEALRRTTPTEKVTEAGTIRKRAQRACRHCRQRKVKCSGGTPQCTQCLRNRLGCEYPPIRRIARKSAPTNTLSDTFQGSICMREDIELGQVVHLIHQFDLQIRNQGILQYIEAYFEFIHPMPSFGFIHRRSFLKALDEGKVSQALQKAICGVSARYMKGLNGNSFKLEDLWMEQAEEDIMQSFGSTSIAHVQVILLLILHGHVTRSFTRVWMLFSWASRLAYMLQLNYEDDTLPFIEQESRRRLMWSLYVADKFLAGGIQEFTLCASQSIHLQLPCKETLFEKGAQVKTEGILPGTETEHLSNMGCRAYLIRLLDIRHKILRYTKHAIVQKLQPWKPASEFWTLLADLQNYNQSLPDHFRLDIQISHLKKEQMCSRSYTTLRTWWSQCHCDLYRIMIPNLRESLCEQVQEQTPKDFLLLCRTECTNFARDLSTFWKVSYEQNHRLIVKDHVIAVCSFHTVIYLLYAATSGHWKSSFGELADLLRSNLTVLDELTDISEFASVMQNDIAELIRRSQFNLVLKQDLEKYSCNTTTVDQSSTGKKDSRHIFSYHSTLYSCDKQSVQTMDMFDVNQSSKENTASFDPILPSNDQASHVTADTETIGSEANKQLVIPNQETTVVDLWSPDLLELYSTDVDQYRNIFDYRINPYLRIYNDWLPGFSSADMLGETNVFSLIQQQMES